MTEAIAEAWSSAGTIEAAHDPESARVFLPNGKAPVEGDVFRNPDLAQAYRLIAEQGRGCFL